MSLSSFIKKLIATDTIWGGRSKKVTGINDSSVKVIDASVTAVASSNSITLTTVPSWLIVGKYFRIKDGGGGNEDKLFKVGSIDGNTIVNDATDVNVDSVVDFGPGAATVDGRMWIVVNDSEICAEDPNSGGTMFNVHNYNSSGMLDGSGLVGQYATHYHGTSAVNAENVAYDNSASGLTAEQVQAAIDELKVLIDNSSLNTLTDVVKYLSSTYTYLVGNTDDGWEAHRYAVDGIKMVASGVTDKPESLEDCEAEDYE